jgi:hypothetical protein
MKESKLTFLITTDYAGLWQRVPSAFGIRLISDPQYIDFRYPEWYGWITIAQEVL